MIIRIVAGVVLGLLIGSHDLAGSEKAVEQVGLVESSRAFYDVVVAFSLRGDRLVIDRVIKGDKKRAQVELNRMNKSRYPAILKPTKAEGCVIFIKDLDFSEGVAAKGESITRTIKNDVVTFRGKRYQWSMELKKAGLK